MDATVVGRKRCTRCREAKPVEEFPRSKQMRDGLSSWCRACHRAAIRASHEKAKGRLPSVDSKRCRCCGETKPARAFHADPRHRDGLNSWCRKCRNAANHAGRRRRHEREGRTRKPLAERFESRVLVTDGCWLWQGRKNERGYGVLKDNHRYLYAHRVAYELHVAPIPSTHHVHHLCGNRGCVRPDHLALVERVEHERMHARMWAAARALDRVSDAAA